MARFASHTAIQYARDLGVGERRRVRVRWRRASAAAASSQRLSPGATTIDVGRRRLRATAGVGRAATGADGGRPGERRVSVRERRAGIGGSASSAAAVADVDHAGRRVPRQRARGGDAARAESAPATSVVTHGAVDEPHADRGAAQPRAGVRHAHRTPSAAGTRVQRDADVRERDDEQPPRAEQRPSGARRRAASSGVARVQASRSVPRSNGARGAEAVRRQRPPPPLAGDQRRRLRPNGGAMLMNRPIPYKRYECNERVRRVPSRSPSRRRSVPSLRRAGATSLRPAQGASGEEGVHEHGMVVADALNIISRDGGAFVSRWLHVVVGITWIGLLYYFNFVQVPAFAEMEAAARNNAIDKLASRALWWFRWAAVATVATGILILLFQPARRATIQLFDTDYLKTSPGMCIATGILLALIMFLNVWGVIWRNQKKVIANARNVQAGGEADPRAAAAGRKAGLASRRTRSSRSRC